MCIYFEVDQTNIPEYTIALIADEIIMPTTFSPTKIFQQVKLYYR